VLPRRVRSRPAQDVRGEADDVSDGAQHDLHHLLRHYLVEAEQEKDELADPGCVAEYHLGNIYAKCGLQGRQQLRRFVEQWHQPTAI
jgi:thiamine monophosphate kinase